VDFTNFSAVVNTPLGSALACLLLVLAGFWITYKVIRAAVRDGIKEAGLYSNRAMAQTGRKQLDPKYDFVYTEPRPE